MVQMYAPQLTVPPSMHAPDPLHMSGLFWTLPLQNWAAHWVPGWYSWQAPVPSQTPFVPHIVGPLSVHSPCGSVLTAIGPQLPVLPEPFNAAVHALQTPEQAESQHTPSAQNVLRQSVPAAQVWPS